MYVRHSGSYKKAEAIYVRYNGSWQEVTEGFVRRSGHWQRFHVSLPDLSASLVVTESSSDTVNMTVAVTETVTYDADAQAYFTRVEAAGTTLTAQYKAARNQFVLDLKAAGVWSAWDIIADYCQPSLAAALTNIRQNAYNGTQSGTLIFTPNDGVQANGGNDYISYPLVLPQNSASVAVGVRDYIWDTQKVLIGTDTGQQVMLHTPTADDGSFQRLRIHASGDGQSGLPLPTTFSDLSGMTYMVRQDANNCFVTNGATTFPWQRGSSVPAYTTLRCLTNFNGYSGSPVTSFLASSSAVTADQIAATTAAFAAFRAAMGAAPLKAAA